ncbi:phage portal protein [Bacillus chungangensis]|uniref:Portal protein n=1 Tax=Bacillus chungangensis TaxID=587633 RepID=A0ABT9WMD1_9BACI|nr:phage portal protein [Bacillus chungangensis]MDQ0174387.1 hypothetical protein [Bacillus chungangensis]
MTLFVKGAQFPPQEDLERLARYERMRKLFDGKQAEIYERATEVLKGTPAAAQIEKLYIAVNLADIIATKPADLLIGDPPTFESGEDDDSPEQIALNKYIEENDLNHLIYESAIANGYRADAWIKVRWDYQEDYSEVLSAGLPLPDGIEMEPIVEHVDATCVFPETSNGNIKKFKAINIATVEWVETKKNEIPYLNVERHIPGYIQYKRFRLISTSVDTYWGAPIQTFYIEKEVPTGRATDIVETGLSYMPVFHIPYKSIDDRWEGIGGLEKMESTFTAINDRLVQIDYILWKHADPTAYGPDLTGNSEGAVRFGGKYIPITKEDATPGYMTWEAQLESAFRELDILISSIFIIAETPQWLFGTVMAGDQKGGTGTSHTDSSTTKARFMPILSKVKRIRAQYERAIRDALYTCYLFDQKFGTYEGEAVYPTIRWQDGLPKNEKEEAEIASIRTGGKPTLDVHTAIKSLDDVGDKKATEIIRRINEDEDRETGTVNSTVFNEKVEVIEDDEA